MTKPLFATLLRSVITELDRRAKTISCQAFVTLEAWPQKWILHVWNIGKPNTGFEGDDLDALFAQADAFLTEHEPEMVARTLGIETQPHTAA